MKTIYVFQACVTNVVEEIERFNWRKNMTDNTVTHDQRSRGWFIALDGSHERIFIGQDKPNIQKGDTIKITMEKI